MNIENLSTLQIHKLTQEQYDRELVAGRIDSNAIYLTPDTSIFVQNYEPTGVADGSLWVDLDADGYYSGSGGYVDSSSTSSEPDLVIGLNVTNVKKYQDEKPNWVRNISNMKLDDISIMGGDVHATAEKVRQGIPVKVVLNDIHFYADDVWFKGVSEAAHVLIRYLAYYPDESRPFLDVAFVLSDMGTCIGNNNQTFVRISFNLETGKPTWCKFDRLY